MARGSVCLWSRRRRVWRMASGDSFFASPLAQVLKFPSLHQCEFICLFDLVIGWLTLDTGHQDELDILHCASGLPSLPPPGWVWFKPSCHLCVSVLFLTHTKHQRDELESPNEHMLKSPETGSPSMTEGKFWLLLLVSLRLLFPGLLSWKSLFPVSCSRCSHWGWGVDLVSRKFPGPAGLRTWRCHRHAVCLYWACVQLDRDRVFCRT